MRQKREIEFNAIYLSYFLKKYWKIILLSSIMGISVAYVYNFLAKPLYKSEISIFTWNRSMSDAVTDVKTQQEEKKTSKVEELMMYNSIISQSLHVGQILISDYMTIMNNPSIRQTVSEELASKGFKPPFQYTFNCSIKRQSCIMKIEVISNDGKLAAAAADALVNAFKNEQLRLMAIRYAESMHSATIPLQPFSPRKGINLLIGFFIGLMLGGGISFLLDLLDMTIKNPDDLKNLGLLPLGYVQKYKDISTLFETDENQEKNRIGNSLLDSVRIISTTISFLRVDNPPRVIVFASALPGSGKSTLSLLLAKIRGMGSMRILLISCDLRKPFTHKEIKDATPEGLVNYLKDNHCNDPEKYIHKNVFQNVDIMTHGVIPPNPAELLESKRFADMLENLKSKYDFIFLDSPPCSGMPDAMILGGVADAIVVAIEAGKTKMNDILRTMEQFGSLRSKIMGAILNKVVFDKGSNYYYSNYGYYYGKTTQDDISSGK